MIRVRGWTSKACEEIRGFDHKMRTIEYRSNSQVQQSGPEHASIKPARVLKRTSTLNMCSAIIRTMVKCQRVAGESVQPPRHLLWPHLAVLRVLDNLGVLFFCYFKFMQLLVY